MCRISFLVPYITKFGDFPDRMHQWEEKQHFSQMHDHETLLLCSSYLQSNAKNSESEMCLCQEEECQKLSPDQMRRGSFVICRYWG